MSLAQMLYIQVLHAQFSSSSSAYRCSCTGCSLIVVLFSNCLNYILDSGPLRVSEGRFIDRKIDRYPCDQCDYASTYVRGLKRQNELKHEGIRYLCDQCDYAATHAYVLKRHKESKYEDIRYPWDQCDDAATNARGLKRHKESKH